VRKARQLGFVAVGVSLALAASAAAAFSGASSNPANTFKAASNFCANPGTQTVNATKDATIRGLLEAGANFGGQSTLIVTPGLLGILGLGVAPGDALVHFDLPAVPARCQLTGATLRLYDANPTGGRTIRVARLAGSWNENSVTWNNAPGTTGAEVTSTSPGSAGWQSWNVLSQTQAMYSGSNHGFRVFEPAGLLNLLYQQTYQSREGTPDSQDPQLQLTFD